MKKNMKKLLVIALALMPSLSILAMNPSGFSIVPDPEVIPIIAPPGSGNGGPRIAPLDYDDIPLKPLPDPDPNPNPIPRLISYGDDVIPIKPIPDSDDHSPRIRSNGPDDIPVVPDPTSNPGGGPRFRNSAQAPYCCHIGGVVYIDADATITYITATITRDGDNISWTGCANANTLTINASSGAGVYRLKLTLSDGRYYIGKYLIK